MKKSDIPIEKNGVLKKKIILRANSVDASSYRLAPRLVVKPQSILEMRDMFDWAVNRRRHITFRAAGTSLSGQSVGDDVLAVVKSGWENYRILDGASAVAVEPGLVAGKLNRVLARSRRKIGPDPASIDSCAVGGMIANNSGGMTCGVDKNPYKTIKSLKVLLPDGTFVDSGSKNADDKLRLDSPRVFNGLLDLRKRIFSNPAVKRKIAESYNIKNTIGYSMNSFLDFDSPAKILAHLAVGSEGTLMFVAEAVFKTFPVLAHSATGILFYENMRKAGAVILALKDMGATAVEFMDYAALCAVKNLPDVPDFIKKIPEGCVGLLFEFNSDVETELAALQAELTALAAAAGAMLDLEYARDAATAEKYWNVRRGLLPTLGAARPAGSSLLIEDLSLPVEALPDAIADLRRIFEKRKIKDAAVYGHGLDGNLHFLASQSLAEPDSKENIADLFEDMFSLCKKHGGWLKGEHGTGRNMAPFVSRQWGSDIYKLMKEVKSLIDPHGILNPGVLLNDDETIHVNNLKASPPVDETIDSCIECGFCESVCPSRDVTLTPRQRIAVARQISEERRNFWNGRDAGTLKRQADYYSVETCAVDGMCAEKCPVGINVGEYVKKLRAAKRPIIAREAAALASNYFKIAETSVKIALQIARRVQFVAGAKALTVFTQILEKAAPVKRIPKWNENIGAPAKIPETSRLEPDAVYYPACVSRMTGASPDGSYPNIMEAIVAASAAARLRLKIPRDVEEYCCGMVYSSKGFVKAYKNILNKTVAMFWLESRGGKIPILVDSSSCAQNLKTCRDALSEENKAKYDKMTILDSVEFLHDFALPKLKLVKIDKKAALHKTCSLMKMKLDDKFVNIASACAREVYVPIENECCGYAGDRGALYPELTESASAREAREIKISGAELHYSSNIPCETAMTIASGKKYKHIAYLILESIDAARSNIDDN